LPNINDAFRNANDVFADMNAQQSLHPSIGTPESVDDKPETALTDS